jgi:hypothetical protein
VGSEEASAIATASSDAGDYPSGVAWPLVAIGAAALVLAALSGCGGGAGSAGAAPLPPELLPLLVGQLDCGGKPLVMVRQHTFDFTGDGVPDALAAVRCDVGAGNPPSAVFAVAATRSGPQIVGQLLRLNADEIVSELSGQGGDAVVTAFAFGPGAPRCCPDQQAVHRYHWAATAFDAGSRTTTPLPTAGPTDAS